MVKLIALYRSPEDPAAFDKAYFETHIPLLKDVPGLQRTVVTRFSRALAGEPLYLMAEMYFEDAEARKAALRSPQMAAAGQNLNSFAEGLYTLLLGEEL